MDEEPKKTQRKQIAGDWARGKWIYPAPQVKKRTKGHPKNQNEIRQGISQQTNQAEADPNPNKMGGKQNNLFSISAIQTVNMVGVGA